MAAMSRSSAANTLAGNSSAPHAQPAGAYDPTLRSSRPAMRDAGTQVDLHPEIQNGCVRVWDYGLAAARRKSRGGTSSDPMKASAASLERPRSQARTNATAPGLAHPRVHPRHRLRAHAWVMTDGHVHSFPMKCLDPVPYPSAHRLTATRSTPLSMFERQRRRQRQGANKGSQQRPPPSDTEPLSAAIGAGKRHTTRCQATYREPSEMHGMQKVRTRIPLAPRISEGPFEG